jgi:hypothetical protein
MGPREDKIYFEEDLGFFMKKKSKDLGLGLVLILIPPAALSFMFFDLLRWSSLFEEVVAQILIFLLLAPVFGLYFILRVILIRRMRIYSKKIPNPSILGRRTIPLDDIKYVALVFRDNDPKEMKLLLRKGSKAAWYRDFKLGKFLDKDTGPMMDAFRKRGVETRLI